MSETAKIPSTVGFYGCLVEGVIGCLSFEDELWDPFIVINISKSALIIILPHMICDACGNLQFGEDRCTQSTDSITDTGEYLFVEQHGLNYVCEALPVEIDDAGDFYVQDTDIKIVFPSSLEEILQRPHAFVE